MRLALPAITPGLFLFALGCADNEVSTNDRIEAPLHPWFEDQAVRRGLNFQYQSGHADRYLLPEMLGGGAALADVDNDGDLDAYLVQGGPLLSDDRPGNQLFLNRGDGHFVQVADAGGAGDTGYGMGVAAGDYDNDGDVDLYVTNFGRNVLLRNRGNGQFDDVSVVAGVDDAAWSTAAAFLDLDVDGDLDLFVVNYVNWNVSSERECLNSMAGSSLPDYCPPHVYDAPTRDRLYRNDGDGTFTEVSDAAGLGAAFGNGLGVVGLDANGDELTDIFVANDENLDQLWLNRGDLRFEDEALIAGCAMDANGFAKAGMGVTAADQDNDGDTDLLVVNLATESDSFFRNEGTYFVDATVSVGLATASMRFTRFGVVMADFDNDSRLDLYEANGAISTTRESIATDVYAEPNLLLRGLSSGRFEEVKPRGGTQRPLIYTSRGLAIGDIDNDGGLDLLIINRDAPVNLLMNRVTRRGNWTRFRVLTRAGRDAHAATVSADIGSTRIYRDVQPAGSYLASHDPRVHFGLGDERQAGNVTVRWPGGALEMFGDFKAADTVLLKRGEGTDVNVLDSKELGETKH
jgi:hypothetical protein|tara:strand:+ start:4644 stop:6368 length:1725 start_codon:yes stop_codon:yes gene_type:complete